MDDAPPMADGSLSEFPLPTLLQSYWAWAFGIAAAFYGAMRFFGGHLSQGAREGLALWLLGAHESTWTRQFCQLFDTVFGERHLSWRCFVRSAIASFVAVVALWALVDPVLGLLEWRTLSSLDLWQALLLGAAINVLPDYLSLLETRWLLRRFEAADRFREQLLLLVGDAFLTGLIIWLAINGFLLLRGEAQLSTAAMLGLFSIYSIFFYSTFLTSVWAWLYCLSTWFMRLFSRTFLKRLLDVEEKPAQQVALVGSALLLASTLALAPVLQAGAGDDQVSWFDEQLCAVFPSDACPLVARLTENERERLSYLARACAGGGGGVERCVELSGSEELAAAALELLCDEGDAWGCNNLGWMFQQGRRVPQDDAEAVALYRQACDGGHLPGCNNLGWMLKEGLGVPQDDAEAVAVYRQACDGGEPAGCVNLGWMFREGRGVAQDDAQAAALYRQACDGGNLSGCGHLGWMFKEGQGVPQDDAEAVALYRRACASDETVSCNNLGWMFREGRGVAQDDAMAVAFFLQACDGGNLSGCNSLGWMHQEGRGVPQDDAEAVTLYRQACDGGNLASCYNLGWTLQRGRGVPQDDAEAATLFRQACDGGIAQGCQSLEALEATEDPD